MSKTTVTIRTRAALGLAALAGALLMASPAMGQRVVPLTPFTANTTANLGIRPVAVGQTLGGLDRFSSRLRGVPILGLQHPTGPNIEQLAARRPQLVLSASTWRRGTPAMQRLGIRVVESEPRSVAQVPAQTRALGRLLGRSRQGEALARGIESRIRRVTSGIRSRPTVLVVLGVGRSTFAFLDNSFGGDVVKAAGGRLLTQGLRASGGFAQISDETVVARNPDVIIAVPHGNVRDIPRTAQMLANKPGWRTTKAARNRRVYISTGNSILQPYDTVDRTIFDVRRKFLRNG